MKIVSEIIKIEDIKEMAKKSFGNMVKAVVDIEKEIMALDGGLHADEEALLLENGSRQESLWGINIYPEEKGDKFIEFDSMINLRPNQNNRSRSVDDPLIRKKIISAVMKVVRI